LRNVSEEHISLCNDQHTWAEPLNSAVLSLLNEYDMRKFLNKKRREREKKKEKQPAMAIVLRRNSLLYHLGFAVVACF
jgi:hypothetical protein